MDALHLMHHQLGLQRCILLDAFSFVNSYGFHAIEASSNFPYQIWHGLAFLEFRAAEIQCGSIGLTMHSLCTSPATDAQLLFDLPMQRAMPEMLMLQHSYHFLHLSHTSSAT